MRIHWPRLRLLAELGLLALLLVLTLSWLRPTAIPSWIETHWPLWGDWIVTTAILLVLVTVTWSIRANRRRVSAQAMVGSPARLLTDAPIRDASEDAFELSKIAATIARQLSLPSRASSLVVALEGPWGCGKSSLLSLIRQQLALLRPPPILVLFNPWASQKIEDLVDALLEAIVQEVVAAGEPAVTGALDSLRRDAEQSRFTGVALATLQALRAIGRILRHPQDRTSVLSRKDAINAAIQRSDRGIVVLIDDIDRLPPQQIKDVFQLVGGLANFTRTSYLMAYDPKPVYASLEFEGLDGFGRDYKDKIVQVTIPFPRVPYPVRRAYFLRIFTEAAEQWKFRLTDDDRSLLEEAIPLLMRAIRTPRQAKIIVNHAAIGAHIQDDEVCLADLLVLETIAVTFPGLMAAIRHDPAIISGGGAIDEEYASVDTVVRVEGTDKGLQLSEVRGRLFEKSIADAASRPLAKEMLEFVFPLRTPQKHGRGRRLADTQNFLIYLYMGVRSNVFSNSDAERLLYSETDRSGLLEEFASSDALAGFLELSRSRIDKNRPIPDVKGLTEVVVSQSEPLDADRKRAITSSAAYFIQDVLVEAMANEAEKVEALRSVILDPKHVSAGEELFVMLLREIGAWKDGKWLGNSSIKLRSDVPWLTFELVDGIRKEWLSMVTDIPVEVLFSRESSVIGILHRWGQLGDEGYEPVKNAVGNWLDNERANALRLSECFPPGVSFQGIEKLIPSNLDLVKRFRETGVPERQIERLLEDSGELARRASGSQ